MASIAATSLAILPSTGRGVLAGAMTPVTLVQPKLGSPASLKVGTWAKAGRRPSPVTAIAFSLPALMKGITVIGT